MHDNQCSGTFLQVYGEFWEILNAFGKFRMNSKSSQAYSPWNAPNAQIGNSEKTNWSSKSTIPRMNITAISNVAADAQELIQKFNKRYS